LRKSKSIILGLVVVVASFLAASCDGPAKGDRRCVDKLGTTVDPGSCEQDDQRKALDSSYVPNYLWYYVSNQGAGDHAGSVANTDNRNGSSNGNASSASQNSNRRRSAGRGGFGFSAFFFPRAGQ
jgi:hypothetical protein